MRVFLRQWQVAYRLLPQGSIFSDLKTPFTAIPNSLRYTAADPFLYKYNEKTYLFAEIYDKKDGLGKIGYSVFDGKKFSPWKIIISEKYHLSYPNIFKYSRILSLFGFITLLGIFLLYHFISATKLDNATFS